LNILNKKGMGKSKLRSSINNSMSHKLVDEYIERLKPKRTDEQVAEMYLDWVNNFLTLEGFASHYDLSKEDVNTIIDLGRKLNNKTN